MEESVSKQKIETTKKKYTSLLNLSNFETPLKVQQSLSIYGKTDQKNRSMSQKNKIASVFDAFSPEKISEEQLKEVFEIKNRMAKHKIVVFRLLKLLLCFFQAFISKSIQLNQLYLYLLLIIF